MKKRILQLCLMVCASVSGTDLSSVVKVSSGLCGSDSGLFHGSGLAFSILDRNFILTSEHVVLHGNDPYCHSVWSETLGTLPARLVIAEYGNGLALLELKNTAFHFPGLEAMPVPGLEEGHSVQVMGYAHSQKELISKNPGRILIAKSTRKLIPLISQMVETIGAHGEYGMSGGPVLTEKGELVGVLSHQYVRLIPGQKTLISEFSERSSIENHLLVIPSHSVIQWVNSVLKANPASSYFVRDVEEQLRRKEVVLSSGIRFEIVGVEKGQHPVGGGDGAGIGGGDGAGIGGEEVSSQNTGRRVRLSLESSSTNTVWYLPELQSWISAIKENLRLPWKRIEIPFFLSTSEESFQSFQVDSLADFFQKLMRQDLEPVTLVKDSSSNNLRESANTQELRKQGERITEILQALKSRSLPAETRLLLKQVEIVAGLLTSDSWPYLKKKSLENLCNVKAHTAMWKPLFLENFDLAVELLERLNKVSQSVADLKL